MPAPTTATSVAGGDARRQGGVDGAGGGLDHHGVVVGQRSGTAWSWLAWATSAAVDQPPPVSVQKPVWRPGARCPKARLLTQPGVARPHCGAGRVDAPGRAAQDRLDHRAGAGREGATGVVGAAVVEDAHHLVARGRTGSYTRSSK